MIRRSLETFSELVKEYDVMANVTVVKSSHNKVCVCVWEGNITKIPEMA